MTFKRHIIVILFVLSTLNVWGERTIVPQIMSEGNFALASSFLNKYAALVEAPQTVESRDKIRRTKEDGFRYIVGNDENLKGLSNKDDFSLDFNDGQYTAQWCRNGMPIVKCSFPANIGLLTFSNKLDLENSIISRLSNIDTDNSCKSRPICIKNELTKVSGYDFYVYDKGYYLTPRLKHQIVFAPVNANSDSCIMLVDSLRYNLESIANIMLTGASEKSINVKLKISQYGYKNHTFDLPFHLLFNILSEYNSNPYWGVESFDGQTVKGLLVWINPYGGFNHVLSISLPVEALTRNCEANASLHCYIRTDNLKSLFEEYPDI